MLAATGSFSYNSGNIVGGNGGKEEDETKSASLVVYYIRRAIVIIFVAFSALTSFYMGWDCSDPETAVAVAVLHALEWLFVRLAPPALVGSIVGICLTRKKA